MVVLNTKFQVNSDFTRQEMYRLIREWMDDSYFCDDKIRNESEKFDFKTDTFQTATEDGSIQMTVDSYDDTFAIEVVNRDENSIFKTDYILKDKLEQPMFLCVQDKSSTGMNASIQTGAKLPKVLRSIFWNEFCGEDNGLKIDDRPYVLRKQDVPFAVEILNSKNQYDLPIIYVSPDKSGRYSLNYELLASEMVGQAHVMIEGSPVVAALVADASEKKNPYNGAVKVFYPSGQARTYTAPSRDEEQDDSKKPVKMHFSIINDIRQIQAAVAIPDDFNLFKLRQRHLFDKLSQSESSELVQVCQSIVEDKELEVEQLKCEVESLKQKLAVSSSKAANLQAVFDEQKDGEEVTAVGFAVTENPLYEKEIEDVILKVLQKEYDSIKDDPNISRSRKCHVLEDVLLHNFPSGTDAVIMERVKNAVGGGQLSKDGIGRLQQLGFVVTKDNRQAHYCVAYKGDNRYAKSYASSLSDMYRGAQNFVSELRNVLFGY